MMSSTPGISSWLKDLRRVLCCLSACTLLVGCSTLPRDSDPQILRTYAPNPQSESVVGPQPGQEPDLLLRDFYSASAIPTGDYKAARGFLTESAAKTWHPAGPVLLVDAIDLNTAAPSPETSNDENTRTFAVRGTVIGSLESGGSYMAENGAYEASIVVRKVDGEWRIDDLPQGVVIERNELRNQYQPENLYFYESTRRSLIADRRWIYTGQDSLDSELITLLMQGPAPLLGPAVANLLPPGATFAGTEDGTYRFTGMTQLNQEERVRFAAQLVWMLSNAGIQGPFKATADGAPLVADAEVMTIDDFAEFNPRVSANAVPAFYALNEGNLLQLTSNTPTPVAGPLGLVGDITSADISSAGVIAAVRKSGDKSRLVLGTTEGQVIESIEAGTLSRPTFELGGQAAWTVVDGKHVRRFVRGTDGKVVESAVDTSALERVGGEISVLRLSPMGARAAMIVGGRIFVGVIERTDTGDYKIINLHELATELGGTALSVDWHPDGSLIIGTSTAETPIWRVEYDGSSVSTLASGNITAPVVSVAASGTTIYATDARSVLQLSTTDSDSVYWREVPGLQGRRSAPIVAH